MFRESKRLNEYFEIPKGFKVTHILGTSYSLNGETLNEIIKQTKILKNNELKEIDKKLPEHIYIACQYNKYTGGLNYDNNAARLIWASHCINGINTKPANSFHPKVWILRMEEKQREGSRDNRTLYRVIIMSKNISRQDMREAGIMVEGYLQQSDEVKARNDGLIKFVDYLLGKNKGNKVLEEMKKELVKVSFDESFQKIGSNIKYSFIPILPGDNTTKQNNEFDEFKNIAKSSHFAIMISPFIGSENKEWVTEIINEITNANKGECYVVCRKIEPSISDIDFKDNKFSPDCFYYFKKNSDNNESDYTDDIEYDFKEDEIQLHAKVYLFDCDNKSYVYIGSSNLSENGFKNNVEMMVRLEIEESNLAKDFWDIYKEEVKLIDERFQIDNNLEINTYGLPKSSMSPEEIAELKSKVEQEFNLDAMSELKYLIHNIKKKVPAKPGNGQDTKENSYNISEDEGLFTWLVEQVINGTLNIDSEDKERIEEWEQENTSDDLKDVKQLINQLIKDVLPLLHN